MTIPSDTVARLEMLDKMSSDAAKSEDKSKSSENK